MRSSYSFKNKVDFLVMTITGEYDYWDFIKYPKIIRKKCDALAINKVLIDVVPVAHAEIPSIELFFLGEIVAEILRDRIKVALVWKGEDDNGLLRRVAANRAASMRIFGSFKTAEFWLRFDKEDEPKNLFKPSK